MAYNILLLISMMIIWSPRLIIAGHGAGGRGAITVTLNPKNSPESDVTRNRHLPKPVACFSKLTFDCATLILGNDELYTVHFQPKCCKQIKSMGKRCYDFILREVMIEFHSVRAVAMHERSDHLWKLCVGFTLVGDGPSAAPPAMAIAHQKKKLISFRDVIELVQLGWEIVKGRTNSTN